MRNAAHSCMLVATILLTLVFAAAFQVPGGNNQDTGIPVHLKTKWFTCFIVFEAVALYCSTFSIIVCWSIMTSSFEHHQFMQILPNLLKLGLNNLVISLVASVSAFMSTYFLVFVGERAGLVKVVILLVYILLFRAVLSRFDKIWLKTILPASLFQNPMRRSRDMARNKRLKLWKMHASTKNTRLLQMHAYDKFYFVCELCLWVCSWFLLVILQLCVMWRAI